jgi:hypothetical protein
MELRDEHELVSGGPTFHLVFVFSLIYSNGLRLPPESLAIPSITLCPSMLCASFAQLRARVPRRPRTACAPCMVSTACDRPWLAAFSWLFTNPNKLRPTHTLTRPNCMKYLTWVGLRAEKKMFPNITSGMMGNICQVCIAGILKISGRRRF